MKCGRIKNRFLRMAFFILVSPVYIWHYSEFNFDFDGAEFMRFVKEAWRQK